ncbi:MAG: hypothetical protein H7122_09020 [Chitinophagaceae bacterium]|nr:hypothetical protein [Chitinophagaceae bacterium]
MANSDQVKKEFKIYSIEASNSGTPDSYHLISVGSTQKFKTYEDAQKWIGTEGENADYIILEVFSKS